MASANYLRKLERDKPGSSRTFIQSIESENFCLIGTPLPSLNDKKKDRNEYKPIHQQEVLDDQGRRRFHGAFTGGFSAGYFNSVGSAEGWQPSTFQSSRNQKSAKISRPEDFMDEEDLQDIRENKISEKRSQVFDLIDNNDNDRNKRFKVDDIDDPINKLFKPSFMGIGTRIMRNMGWRDGQGVGPRLNIHQAKHQNPSLNVLVEHGSKHTFAPQDVKLYIPPKHIGNHGLGYTQFGMSLRPKNEGSANNNDKISHGFGFGIDEADEDDIEIYDSSSFPSRSIEKGRKLNQLAYDSNQDYNDKFGSINMPSRKSNDDYVGLEFFSDGKPVLRGFILQRKKQLQETTFKPPEIPSDWTPNPLKILIRVDVLSQNKEKIIPKDADDRARILGEKPFIDEKEEENMQVDNVENEIIIPPLDSITANAALRGNIPYNDEDPKKAKYTAYLHSQANPENYPPDIVNIPTENQLKSKFNIELIDFQKTASLFKPMSTAMAGRFTTGSRTNIGLSEIPTFEPGLRPGYMPKPKEPSPPVKSIEELRAERDARRAENETPIQKAVRENNFGIKSGTRIQKGWKPSKLLCKRFQVPPPTITLESEGSETGFQFGNKTGGEAPSFKTDAWEAAGITNNNNNNLPPPPPNVEEIQSRNDSKNNGNNAAVMNLNQIGLGEDPKQIEEISKQQRPSMDVFKSIFGNDETDEVEDNDNDLKPIYNKQVDTQKPNDKISQKKKKKDAKSRKNAKTKLTFDDEDE